MDEERAARRRKRWMALALVGCGAALVFLDPHNPLGPFGRSVGRVIAPAAVMIGLTGLLVPDLMPDPSNKLENSDELLPLPANRAAGTAGCLVGAIGVCIGIAWAILG